MYKTLPMSPLYQARIFFTMGMRNQDMAATVAAQNYVNVDSLGDKPGAKPYRRRAGVFAVVVDPKTKTPMPVLKKVVEAPGPFRAVYRPAHPASDEKGLVLMPNVNRLLESTDYQSASLVMAGCAKLYQLTNEMVGCAHNLMTQSQGQRLSS
jgi:flagellar basal-body rod protein FlgC